MPKISELPAGTTPTGAEKFPAVQGTATARLTLSQVYAATKTFTNTTYDTAATGNSFSINGLAATANTGTGSVVRATSPTLVTPLLGTPTSVTLTNATGLPIATGVANLGTGIATFLTTPSSANLLAAITDETGTGSAVFATSPTLVTPALGTPSALVLTNATGTPSAIGLANGTGLPLSGHATQAAFTVVANATGSAAAPTAVSIPALTQKATPVAADKVMIADSAASDALKYATLTSIVNNIQPTLTSASNVLGADVNLSNTANFFDGPSMAQGSTGAWFAVGTITVNDSSASSANIHVKLYDGTNTIASTTITTQNANAGARTSVTLAGFITSPAGNIRMAAKDITNTTGKILFNQSGLSGDSTIFGFRIA